MSVTVTKGNPLYFPKGNERGEYWEPLWIAADNNGNTAHGRTPELAVQALQDAKLCRMQKE